MIVSTKQKEHDEQNNKQNGVVLVLVLPVVYSVPVVCALTLLAQSPSSAPLFLCVSPTGCLSGRV